MCLLIKIPTLKAAADTRVPTLSAQIPKVSKQTQTSGAVPYLAINLFFLLRRDIMQANMHLFVFHSTFTSRPELRENP